MYCTGILYAEGHSGPYANVFPCIDCEGKKVVPIAMLEWRRRGKEVRRWRRGLRLSLHEVAEKCGMRPSEVSYIEQGVVDNSNWRSVLKVDSFGADLL
jgi:hypothetical protein